MNTLHIVMGPPAAGKTTFGKALAAREKAALIDIDSATEPVIQAGMKLSERDPDDRDSAVFKSTFRKPIYDSLFAIASDNLAQIDVVIVGPFTLEAQEATWVDALSEQFKAKVQVYFVTCDLTTLRQRMEDRGNPRDRAKLADWDTYIQYYDDEKLPLFPHQVVNTGNSSPQ